MGFLRVDGQYAGILRLLGDRKIIGSFLWDLNAVAKFIPPQVCYPFDYNLPC